MKTIALIFDFDDTLLPDSTSELLKKFGIDPQSFWSIEAKSLLDAGYDPTLAYLNLILDRVGNNKPFGRLRNADLRAFGSTLDKTFYPGVRTLFSDLKKLVRNVSSEIGIEFYIISGGLQEIIEGSKLVTENFSAVYGCHFGEDKNGVISHIKKTVTFTEKTRYLFEINKGLKPQDTRSNQYAVNKEVADSKRRISFKHMIYVGDGLTDIPCFSLLKRFGGVSFGVFRPGEEKSARKAFLEFLKTDRVLSTHAPRYSQKAELGSMLRAAVAHAATGILLDQSQAEAD